MARLPRQCHTQWVAVLAVFATATTATVPVHMGAATASTANSEFFRQSWIPRACSAEFGNANVVHVCVVVVAAVS